MIKFPKCPRGHDGLEVSGYVLGDRILECKTCNKEYTASQCRGCDPHLWTLDWKEYFDSYKTPERPTTFPAQCFFCEEKKNFTREEWVQHIEEMKLHGV